VDQTNQLSNGVHTPHTQQVQYGITGDFVVRDAKVKKGDLWVVDKTTFHKIYRLADAAMGDTLIPMPRSLHNTTL